MGRVGATSRGRGSPFWSADRQSAYPPGLGTTQATAVPGSALPWGVSVARLGGNQRILAAATEHQGDIFKTFGIPPPSLA